MFYFYSATFRENPLKRAFFIMSMFTFDWWVHFEAHTSVSFLIKNLKLTFTCNGVFIHYSIATFTQVKDLRASSATDGYICRINTDMKGENQIFSKSQQPNRTSSSCVCLELKGDEMLHGQSSIFLHFFPSLSLWGRLNVSLLLISSPEWIWAQRGESTGVRNDDPEELVWSCPRDVSPKGTHNNTSQ